MKIGIFGDSYADCPRRCLGEHGWPKLLSKKFSVDNYGRSGTSMWWSFEQFLNHCDRYDVIVFSFTSSGRWPVSPSGIEHQAWNIGYVRENDYCLDVLNPYFFEIFPNQLTRYINSSIYRDVIEKCSEKNKYLIRIVPFAGSDLSKADIDMYESHFPLLTGLNTVSHAEEVMMDGVRYNTYKCINQVEIIDHRHCHLNPSNNKIVADWVADCIEQQKYDVTFDGESFSNWVVFDPVDSEILKLTLNRNG